MAIFCFFFVCCNFCYCLLREKFGYNQWLGGFRVVFFVGFWVVGSCWFVLVGAKVNAFLLVLREYNHAVRIT